MGIDTDVKLRSNGRRSDCCQPALLYAADEQFFACQPGGAFFYHFDIADARTNRVTGEMTAIDIAIRQKLYSEYPIRIVRLTICYFVVFVFKKHK